MLRLEFNDLLGRMLRVDDLETLGVSTQTLAEEAIRAGRIDEAVALVDYFHQEMRIMHNIMITWLTDISRYIVARAGETENASDITNTLFKTWRTYLFGEALRSRCTEAIRAATHDPLIAEEAIDLLDKMRLEFKNPHDVLVAWVQNLLAGIAERWGEEAVLESILETHQSIWGDRYENWLKLTPHERMALTVEGMRGGHFSGERRRGDMTLRDDGDRLVMVMELCGSGGVLRRGDPETGRPPHPLGEHGVNQIPHDWTWQKTGVHWYCSHCAIAMEWLPYRQRGQLLRPLDHVMDHDAPCTWYVYKDEADTRAYHYPRTNSPTPPAAPDHGEDPFTEYPGGS
ncbi:MAG: hypothetical protein J5I90_13345 [Caldilineales bacterium]|nr:hypothetical protein [Caldilineales bacterium]